MSRFAKILVLVVLFFGLMLLLTYISPDIKQYATQLSAGGRLPLWIVGLLAPILFAFQKLGDLVRGIFGESGTEKRIRESNESIKVRLAEVEGNVRRIDEWRAREVESRLGRITAWEADVASMRGREAVLDDQISGLRERDQQSTGTRERLQNEVAELQRTIAELRGTMVEDPEP